MTTLTKMMTMTSKQSALIVVKANGTCLLSVALSIVLVLVRYKASIIFLCCLDWEI